MHGSSYVNSTVLKDLVVTDVDDKNSVELPQTYTREKIPVEHEQIRTPEIIKRWRHLNTIANEILPLKLDLEIGININANIIAIQQVETVESFLSRYCGCLK